MYEFHRENNFEALPTSNRWKKVLIWSIILGLFLFLASLMTAPKDFPSGEIITIEDGYSLNKIAQEFQAKNLVKSAGLFESLVVLLEGDRGIAAGDYVFDTPINSVEIARRVTGSHFGIEKIAVTLPEGFNKKEMSVALGTKLSEFNEEEFLFLTKDLEGYLFPDTYFFFATDGASEAVEMLQDTFQKKVLDNFESEIASSSRSLSDIIIMASIIEKEAFDGPDEKEIVSGILWKRLDRGMRLQVDATLKYEIGKESKDLTLDDLADDHPYNTYTRAGLPPTPIGNSGTASIKAALKPKESEYFFYLHDSDGKIHYAKTFEGHKKNIATYLK